MWLLSRDWMASNTDRISWLLATLAGAAAWHSPPLVTHWPQSGQPPAALAGLPTDIAMIHPVDE